MANKYQDTSAVSNAAIVIRNCERPRAVSADFGALAPGTGNVWTVAPIQ